jgi:hypothetical protein
VISPRRFSLAEVRSVLGDAAARSLLLNRAAVLSGYAFLPLASIAPRAAQACRREGILTLGQWSALSPEQKRTIPFMGVKSVARLDAAVIELLSVDSNMNAPEVGRILEGCT